MQLARYVELLYRWNTRMNLTAVRDTEILIRLHIGECLRCAQRIPQAAKTVLDFGSGAGFPGIFIQIVHPELRVTLAESQTKKAGFLREAVRVLDLAGTNVFAGRVEDMPQSDTFDVVALRAVDCMGLALQAATERVATDGVCIILTSTPEAAAIRSQFAVWMWVEEAIPETRHRVLLTGRR